VREKQAISTQIQGAVQKRTGANLKLAAIAASDNFILEVTALPVEIYGQKALFARASDGELQVLNNRAVSHDHLRSVDVFSRRNLEQFFR